MVGVGERVIKTRTAAFVGCGVGGARDLIEWLGVSRGYALHLTAVLNADTIIETLDCVVHYTTMSYVVT